MVLTRLSVLALSIVVILAACASESSTDAGKALPPAHSGDPCEGQVLACGERATKDDDHAFFICKDGSFETFGVCPQKSQCVSVLQGTAVECVSDDFRNGVPGAYYQRFGKHRGPCVSGEGACDPDNDRIDLVCSSTAGYLAYACKTGQTCQAVKDGEKNTACGGDKMYCWRCAE